MPLYEYQCAKCETVFEKRVSMDHRQDDQNCPTCHKPANRREFSTFAVGAGAALWRGGSSPSYDAAPPCETGGGCCGGGACGLD